MANSDNNKRSDKGIGAEARLGDNLALQSKIKNQKSKMERLIEDFLRSLREKNSSPHTIKAYTRDLAEYATYVGQAKPDEIDHVTVRGFLSELLDRGLTKTSVARAL